MNGSIRHAGARHARHHATPRVAPITRAIRSALAVSATVLALSAGTVHAGACRTGSAPTTLVCGVVPQSGAEVAPADLTRVEGGDHPGNGQGPAFAFAGIAALGDIENVVDLDVTGYGTDVRALDVAAGDIVIDNLASISAYALPAYAGGDAGATAVRADRSDWREVEVSDGRFGALEAYDSDLRLVAFTGCRLGYVNLRGSRVTDLTLEGCQIEDLDLAAASVTRLTLVDCTVTRLLLGGAELVDVDLRGLDVAQLDELVGDRFDGVTVAAEQLVALAPALATRLGIRVA